MKITTKKVLFTIIDVVVVLLAAYWCLWLTFYYSATIDGAIYISSDYAIWERNYLVPVQIFGITTIITIASVILYRKLRKKNLIGKRYIALLLFNIIPFWYFAIMQIYAIIYYWDMLY